MEFAFAQRAAEPMHLGPVAGGLKAVIKVLRRLVGIGRNLHIIHEDGPCGFVLARHFAGLAWHCEGMAPSRFPRTPD